MKESTLMLFFWAKLMKKRIDKSKEKTSRGRGAFYHNIGIDIERVDRFHDYQVKKPFFARIYTEKERRYCLSKSSPAEHFAGRFAAKEAVRKALSAFIKEPLSYSDVEIINLGSGLPAVSLKRGRKYGKFYISLSISHTQDAAVAVALATSSK